MARKKARSKRVRTRAEEIRALTEIQHYENIEEVLAMTVAQQITLLDRALEVLPDGDGLKRRIIKALEGLRPVHYGLLDDDEKVRRASEMVDLTIEAKRVIQ
jgi:hypothetical protein